MEASGSTPQTSAANLVLFFLLTYGTLPLLVAALASARENLKVVETQEQINLTHRVEALSGTLAIEIESARDGLQQMALTLASVPTQGSRVQCGSSGSRTNCAPLQTRV